MWFLGAFYKENLAPVILNDRADRRFGVLIEDKITRTTDEAFQPVVLHLFERSPALRAKFVEVVGMFIHF